MIALPAISGLGHSRLGRGDGRSSHFRCAPIATDFCGATENRNVPSGPV